MPNLCVSVVPAAAWAALVAGCWHGAGGMQGSTGLLNSLIHFDPNPYLIRLLFISWLLF